uniref:Galectin n=1 Tax=Parascaris equorum TaxID=6256 RepID=A0A914RWG5_PAREQ
MTNIFGDDKTDVSFNFRIRSPMYPNINLGKGTYICIWGTFMSRCRGNCLCLLDIDWRCRLES